MAKEEYRQKYNAEIHRNTAEERNSNLLISQELMDAMYETMEIMESARETFMNFCYTAGENLDKAIILASPVKVMAPDPIDPKSSVVKLEYVVVTPMGFRSISFPLSSSRRKLNRKDRREFDIQKDAAKSLQETLAAARDGYLKPTRTHVGFGYMPGYNDVPLGDVIGTGNSSYSSFSPYGQVERIHNPDIVLMALEQSVPNRLTNEVSQFDQLREKILRTATLQMVRA